MAYAELTPGELPVYLTTDQLLQSLLSDLVCDHDFTVAAAIGYLTYRIAKAADALSLEIEDVQT